MSTLSKEGSLQMFTLPMLKAAVRRHPEGAQGWLRETLQGHQYIEAQVWGEISPEFIDERSKP